MISIFDEKELELLISGMPEISIADLKRHTDYVNCKPSDPPVRWFWAALETFSKEEKVRERASQYGRCVSVLPNMAGA